MIPLCVTGPSKSKMMAMSTSEISEMKSPYKQIFKFEGQHRDLRKLFFWGGHNYYFGKIRLISKQAPQGQLWRKDTFAPKPMHQHFMQKKSLAKKSLS